MGNERVDLATVVKPHERRSLLQKYDIPVENLSYEYITECSDTKELERIVSVLRSGEEGIFPDLIGHAEICLARLNPSSKILRVEEPVITRAMLEPEDRKIIDQHIARWTNEMRAREKDLKDGESLSLLRPPVRQPEIRRTVQRVCVKKVSERKNECCKKKSIASCDYESWDKFDADAELDRMDLSDEREQLAAKNAQREHREKCKEATKLSKESMVDKLTLTGTELVVISEREKNIGNEAYRAGDYEEALTRYNCSISLDSNNVKAHNNRAITYIKLERYDEAVGDCNFVLGIDYDNVTALARRGLALEKLDNNSQALVDYQTVLKLEPNNKIAVAAVDRLRKRSDSKKVVRMKIEEVDDVEVIENAKDEEEEEEDEEVGEMERKGYSEICFCDRAPGSSQNLKPPPHYKSDYCPSRRYRRIIGQSKSEDSYFNDVRMTAARETRVESNRGEDKSQPPRSKFVDIGKSIDFDDVESPYEFLRIWQSLRNDTDLSLREKLLRSLHPEDLNIVIGNKLDGSMLAVMIRCLEKYFTNNERDVAPIRRFLISLAKLERFSIIRLFMDKDDKRVLTNILDFLEGKISPTDAAAIRDAYNL